MKNKSKIKVIKRNDLKNINKTPPVTEKNQQQGASKVMVSTVSAWINEFQQRRLEETKQAFEQFLTHPTSSHN